MCAVKTLTPRVHLGVTRLIAAHIHLQATVSKKIKCGKRLKMSIYNLSIFDVIESWSRAITITPGLNPPRHAASEEPKGEQKQKKSPAAPSREPRR